MRKVCKICGEDEDAHHEPEWIEVPDNCCCATLEWDLDKLDKIPDVCGEYLGNGTYPCLTCDHDKECHKLIK